MLMALSKSGPDSTKLRDAIESARRLQGRDVGAEPSRTAPTATTRSRARTCSRRCGRTASCQSPVAQPRSDGAWTATRRPSLRGLPQAIASGLRLRQHLRADRAGLLRHVHDDRDAELRPGRLPDGRRQLALPSSACWSWSACRSVVALLVGLAMIPLVMAVMGMVVERVAIRPLRRALLAGLDPEHGRRGGDPAQFRRGRSGGASRSAVPSIFGDNAIRVDDRPSSSASCRRRSSSWSPRWARWPRCCSS